MNSFPPEIHTSEHWARPAMLLRHSREARQRVEDEAVRLRSILAEVRGLCRYGELGRLQAQHALSRIQAIVGES